MKAFAAEQEINELQKARLHAEEALKVAQEHGEFINIHDVFYIQ
jgi:hypothetical protein